MTEEGDEAGVGPAAVGCAVKCLEIPLKLEETMSRLQVLRLLVQQRLTAAAEEIFGVFERTIEEYEEELGRQRRLLDKAKNESAMTDLPQLFNCTEEMPFEQQEWSPGSVQEEPEPTLIKEEEEELWSSQEEEQLQGVKEGAYITKSPFTPVPVKSDSDEEEAQSSQLHQSQTGEEASSSTEQMKTEADGEDRGLSEPARNLGPAAGVQPASDGQFLSSHCCETDIEDSEDEGMETREHQSGLDTIENNEMLPSHKELSVGKPFKCSVCGKGFSQRRHVQEHVRTHTGEKPFSCTVCGKRFSQKGAMQKHTRIHTEKPFTCPVCGKGFSQRGDMHKHTTTHTEEKPFSCSICGKEFSQNQQMKRHMKIHTGEKPFSCLFCDKRFHHKYNLKLHLRIHTGEKPYSCSGCQRTFNQLTPFKFHKCVTKNS